MQSTVLDGHCMEPDFDLSAIKGNAATSALPSPNDKNRDLELETFLLAFLTAKMFVSFRLKITRKNLRMMQNEI